MPDTPPQLLKGLEEEVYTGTPDGDVVGMSNQVAADLRGFDCEPDSRNVEFATRPHRDYAELEEELMSRRMILRDYLKSKGNLTLVPGGALSLDGTGRFIRAKPNDPYHTRIEKTYGSNVVTASEHINIGIEDPEDLLRAWRVIRCEAALFLALTACSPFFDGQLTGYHSYRWKIFPKTPLHVPLFATFAEYIGYIEAALASGDMWNIRHIWLNVRPNGLDAPHKLERLELRICDRIPDPDLLFAVTALLEARVWQVLETPDLDPLRGTLSPDELIRITDENEEAVSRNSLDAEVTRWESGEKVRARDWIQEWIQGARPVAEIHGFGSVLAPITRVLENGNTAMQWLGYHDQAGDVREVLRRAIRETTEIDLEHTDRS